MRPLANRPSHSRVKGRHVALFGAAAALLIGIGGAHITAHKAITSQYTYNDDIFPILQQKCGQCHVDGGPAPMSLLTYNDDGGAVAWAESIKEMLIANAMPPYYADPTGPATKNLHFLTPRELDKLLTWSAGGTPHGDLNKEPPPSKAKVTWSMGKPDATVPMAEEVALGPGEMEKIVDVKLPTGFSDAKWVKAVDLLPGTPSIVRQATISIANGSVLAVWEPGDSAAAAPDGSAFKIPAGATLNIHLRYRKGWQDEQETRTDRSTVGFYFTTAPTSGKDIQSLVVDGPATEGASAPKFDSTLKTGGTVLAVRPQVDQVYASMDVNAVDPSGKRIPLLKLRAPRPEWPRRYWLVEPVDVSAGSKIEVTTVAGDRDSGPLGPKFVSPLQVAFDIVAK